MRRSACALVLLGGAVLLPPGGAAASPKPLPLKARLIRRGEFAGFRPEAATSRYTTPRAWVAADQTLSAAQASAEVTRLRHEGFRELLGEYLTGTTSGQDGLSWVMQLRSAAAARAELAAILRNATQTGQAPETFRVGTVPGARGFGAGSTGGGGENVVFADGPYLYLVGDGWQGSTRNPRHSALVTAATRLYRRVHGHDAGSGQR